MTTQMSDDVVTTVRRRITPVGRELEGVRGAIPEITDGIADGAGEFAWLLTRRGRRVRLAAHSRNPDVLGNATDVVVSTTQQQRDDLTTIDDRRGS